LAEGLVFEDPRSGRRLELTPHTDLALVGQIIREVTRSLGAALIDVRQIDGAIVADFRVSVGSLPRVGPSSTRTSDARSSS
jgi:hypothetical protein